MNGCTRTHTQENEVWVHRLPGLQPRGQGERRAGAHRPEMGSSLAAPAGCPTGPGTSLDGSSHSPKEIEIQAATQISRTHSAVGRRPPGSHSQREEGLGAKRQATRALAGPPRLGAPLLLGLEDRQLPGVGAGVGCHFPGLGPARGQAGTEVCSGPTWPVRPLCWAGHCACVCACACE